MNIQISGLRLRNSNVVKYCVLVKYIESVENTGRFATRASVKYVNKLFL